MYEKFAELLAKNNKTTYRVIKRYKYSSECFF